MPIHEALRTTLLDITAVPSPIGEEQALCNVIEDRLCNRLGRKSVQRFANNLVVRANDRSGKAKVALVGHLDTVRTEHDGPPRIEGDRLFGCGAADMKSGLAVMLELTDRLDLERLPCDLTLIFYEREEGPYAENMLGPVLERFVELRHLDLAICLEPSDNRLQLGCMGSVHVTASFRGRTAHSARPWQGENAIHKAASLLTELAARPPTEVIVDGHAYREVISATLATGGRSRNIVPDLFDLNLNARFAPGRTPEEVVTELRAIVGDRADILPTDLSPAGHPHAHHPLVGLLAKAGVRAVEVKQAWTDVARFDAVGVAAVNLGPGTQAQAHQRNEYTDLPQLYAGYELFERFLLSLPDQTAG